MAPMGYPYLDCSHGDPRAMAPMEYPHLDQPRRFECESVRWRLPEILIWIAATEIRERWPPWEILFTADGLDPMGKVM